MCAARFEVDRLLPHAKPGEDVRGHVQRVWHLGCDLCIAGAASSPAVANCRDSSLWIR